MSLFRSLSLVPVALCFVATAFASDKVGEATLHRDEWGVPYIYAATDEDAMFALGYAQAEDRLGDLFANIRTAIGRMSEAFGKEYIDQDYAMRISKNAERCEAYWATAPAHITVLSESFIRGVQQYMAEHPDRVPEWAVELEPWHTAAIGNAMILRWPLGQIQDDLKNTQNSTGFGSNEWSVSPKRSADGSAILLTDPHLTWEGMAVFYEANVVAKNLEMHGFFLVGSPMVALGHTGNVGWAATTGGPDTADVYQLKLNPANQLEYEFDGKWKKAKLEFITIPVKGEPAVTRPAGFTDLGPLFSEPDREKNIAYTGLTPYFETASLVEQFYAMCTAKNADEFYKALSMNLYMEQNIMFADREGNTGYVRTGRVPIRPDGYDWTKAVPGDSSKTAWLGIHDIKDLVQVRNPEQGYMQNCNISPRNMMLDSPMQPEKYKPYIFNETWDTMNTRGTRALQLLSEDDSVTKEEAMSFTMDVTDVLAKPWQKALADALAKHGADILKDADFKTVSDWLLEWDGQFVKDSHAAPYVRFWRAESQDKVDNKKLLANEALTDDEYKALLDGLAAAIANVKKTYGKTDITWGDIYKIGRNGKLFPVDGVVLGSGNDRTRTLFNVGAKELEKGSGVYVADNGSMSICLMFFRKEGIEAYTCTPWGQSADPASPHHTDQSEKLYSQRKFKQMWKDKTELMKHVESTKVLKTS